MSNRLKQLREEKGLSLNDMSEKTGFPYQTLRNYEIEKRQPKRDVWDKLADFFGVSTAYIMGLSQEKGPILSIGKKMKQLRITKDMTQKELARLSNNSESTIRKYELGQRNPKIETIKKIANALDVQQSYFLDIEQDSMVYVSKDEYLKLLRINDKYEAMCKIVAGE